MSADRHSSRTVEADDEHSSTKVATFLADGLQSGEPAIAIDTEARLSLIVRALAVAKVDVDEARRAGTLTLVDADQILELVVVDGKPDAARFEARVGSLIDHALRGSEGTLAHLYSGMVDLLSARGQTDAAIDIERLFYGLGRRHAFSLLCGHATSGGSQDPAPPTRLEPPRPRQQRALTSREEDVLRRSAFGQTNKDIANGLGISVRTVEAHKANAMRKLGLVERVDVIRFAVSKGWLTPAQDSSD